MGHDTAMPTWRRWLSWPLGRHAAVPLMTVLGLLLLAAALIPQQRSLEDDELLLARERNPVLMAALEEVGATRVAGSPALVAGCVILVLSLALDTARRARSLPGRLSRQSGLLSADAIGRATHAVEVPDVPAAAIDQLDRALRLRGYRVRRDGERLQAERGRSGVVGSVLFHGGMVLLAVGALWSTSDRFHGVLALGEGQSVDGSLPEAWSMRLPASTPAEELPPLRFRVGDLRLEFAQDGTLTDSRVALITEDGRSHDIAVNEPYRVDGVAVRLADYGLAPVFVVRDPQTRLERGAAVKLQVLPAGRVDQFAFPDLDRTFDVQVYPDARREGGVLSSASARLERPVVVLSSGDETVELPLGGGATLGGMSVRMPEIVYWVRLEVDRDPARGLVFGSLLVGMAGLCWRLLAPWVRVDAARSERGVVLSVRGERNAGHGSDRLDQLLLSLRSHLQSPGGSP